MMNRSLKINKKWEIKNLLELNESEKTTYPRVDGIYLRGKFIALNANIKKNI